MSGASHSKPVLLFIGAGERTAHIELFRRSFCTISADPGPLCPAAHVAEVAFVAPPLDSEALGPFLSAIVVEHGVQAVIPASDDAVMALDAHRERIEAAGARLLLASSEAVQIAYDRAQTFCFLIAQDIPTPPLFDPKGRMQFPVLVKPAAGFGRRHAFLANSPAEVDFFCRYLPDAVVQRAVTGEEYEVDIFCDLDGHVLSVVPMRCIATTRGDVMNAVTVKDRALIDHSVRIATALGAAGPISLRAVRDCGEVLFTDISCCMGSGLTLSAKAGAHPARMLASALAGRHVRYSENWTDGLMLARAQRDYYFEIEDMAQAGLAAELSDGLLTGSGG